MLMLAMSLPGAAKALGLGDIRIDSALNEPLSAQIDIVGATREELVELTAKVANREIFQRYGADRPSFLSTATFKVGLDSNGRPVLNVRSAEAFTDPVINFLVDLRWGRGELIREYSLLLDPAGLSPSTRLAENAAGAAAPAAAAATANAPAAYPVENASSTANAATGAASAAAPVIAARAATAAAIRPASIGSQHRVVAHDTLRSIARRAGASTEPQAQRTMIAIFRANPHAFEGNINILHLGALLSIPSAEEVAAIDAADAKREVRAHMTAWRLNGRQPAPAAASTGVAATPPASSAGSSTAVAAAAVVADPAAQSADEAATAALKDRVQSLEKALEEMHRQLAAENAKIQDLKQLDLQQAAAQGGAQPAGGLSEATSGAKSEATEATAGTKPDESAVATMAGSAVKVERMRVQEHPEPVLAALAPPAQTQMGKGLLGALAAALALLSAGFLYLRRRAAAAAAASAPAIPVEMPSPLSADLPREAATPQPESTAAAKSAPSRVQERPAPVAADAIVAREITLRQANTDFDETMGIDTVALERSYLDALGVDSYGIDDTAPHKAVDGGTAAPAAAATSTATAAATATATAPHDTSEMNTVAIDTSELDTAVIQSDLNTVILDTKKLDPAAVNGTVLDYNLLDLDATTQHVHMPSDLLDQPVVKDRRTNIVDVLKLAIERDPERRDLRMKLLETYYGTASTNQRGFLEVVRQLSREPGFLSADDWQKVVMMGRAIAPDDILFAEQPKDDDLADCA
jgi:FimV-like protein